MGRPFLRSLADPGQRAYCCATCRSHLAAQTSLISRAFHARSGRAYLFDSVSNVVEATAEARLLTTGPHTVADVLCAGCGSPVGWVYKACPPGQVYKKDRFCLEREAIRDVVEDDGGGAGGTPVGVASTRDGCVELSPDETDDEDEEDEEDLRRPSPYGTQAAVAAVGGLAALVGSWGWPAAAVAAAAPPGGGERRSL